MFYIKLYSFFQKTVFDSQHALEVFYVVIILNREIDLVKIYLVIKWKDNFDKFSNSLVKIIFCLCIDISNAIYYFPRLFE